MTALEGLTQVMKILDREEREESYQEWAKKWVGQIEIDHVAEVDDPTSPPGVAMLKGIASNLRNALLAGLANRPEAMMFEVGPGPGRQVRFRLSLTVLLARENPPPAERSRIHLV